MLFKRFLFISVVSLIAAQLLILAAQLFNVATRAEQIVFFFLQGEFSFVDLAAQVLVTVLLGLKVLGSSKVLSGEFIIIATQGAAFARKVSDAVTGASQFNVGRIEFAFFVAHITSFTVDVTLSFSDTAVGALNFLIKVTLLRDLASVLSGLSIAKFLETLDFTPHLGALGLHTVGLVAQLVLLSHKVVNTDA